MKRIILTLALLAATTAAFAADEIPVVYYRLPNGLKVVISESHVAPVVTVAVHYGVGFRVEPKGQTGFAHLFEHMMFQGSANAPKGMFDKLLERGGGQNNGSTRLDSTRYYETLPSENVNIALWLEADRMRALDINAENLKNQQNVVSEEVRANVLNQPYGLFEWLDLWQNANENWFNAHNFYGDLADIEHAKLDDVRQFFRTYYAPNNAVLVVAGDVDPTALRPVIESYFADIPLQSVPEPADVAEPKQTKEKRIAQTDKLASVPALAFGYHMPDQESPDYAPMVLLDLILQGDDGSRFYQHFVKDKALTLDWSGGVNFELGNAFDYSGPMLLVSRTTYKPGGSAAAILKDVDAITRDVATKGVTARELADAKVRFRSNWYDELERTNDRATLLASFALFHDEPSRINTTLARFDAVTAAEVQAVAQKYLVPENRTSIDRVPEVAK